MDIATSSMVWSGIVQTFEQIGNNVSIPLVFVLVFTFSVTLVLAIVGKAGRLF